MNSKSQPKLQNQMNNNESIDPLLLKRPSYNPKIFPVVEAIIQSFESLSRSEIRDVLTMVSSLQGLRVISVERPIGPMSVIRDSNTGGSITEVSKRRAKAIASTAVYKKHPDWIAAIAARQTLVDQIKACNDLSIKQGLIDQLHHGEVSMKSLKQQLRGFPMGVSNQL